MFVISVDEPATAAKVPFSITSFFFLWCFEVILLLNTPSSSILNPQPYRISIYA